MILKVISRLSMFLSSWKSQLHIFFDLPGKREDMELKIESWQLFGKHRTGCPKSIWSCGDEEWSLQPSQSLFTQVLHNVGQRRLRDPQILGVRPDRNQCEFQISQHTVRVERHWSHSMARPIFNHFLLLAFECCLCRFDREYRKTRAKRLT